MCIHIYTHTQSHTHLRHTHLRQTAEVFSRPWYLTISYNNMGLPRPLCPAVVVYIQYSPAAAPRWLPTLPPPPSFDLDNCAHRAGLPWTSVTASEAHTRGWVAPSLRSVLRICATLSQIATWSRSTRPAEPKRERLKPSLPQNGELENKHLCFESLTLWVHDYPVFLW